MLRCPQDVLCDPADGSHASLAGIDLQVMQLLIKWRIGWLSERNRKAEEHEQEKHFDVSGTESTGG